MRPSLAWLVILLVPSVASAGDRAYLEMVVGAAFPRSGDTSGDLDYTDQVATGPKVGLRAGAPFRRGPLYVGPEVTVDSSFYGQPADAAAETWRTRYLAGGRAGIVTAGGRGTFFVRAAAGVDVVTVDFDDPILHTLCGGTSTDYGPAWEVGAGAGVRVDPVTVGVQLGLGAGYHGDHAPVCPSQGGFAGATVDVLDYDAIDVDLLAGVSASF